MKNQIYSYSSWSGRGNRLAADGGRGTSFGRQSARRDVAFVPSGRLPSGTGKLPVLPGAGGILAGILLVALLALSVRAQSSTNAPQTVKELQERISAIISQHRYDAGEWGIKIASLDSGVTLFEHDAGKLFSPASNSKLYTMAMVLDRLGPDYRIKTSLYAQAKPDQHGVIQGDLIVYGRGDPTINEKLHGNDIYKALEPLVAILTNAEVKEISGDLIGDDSYFHSPPFGSSWDWGDFQEYYGAEISALTINDNTLSLMVTPGDEVGAPCKLSFDPETSYVTVSNRTRTVAKGGRRKIEQYRPVGENVVYLYGEVPIGSTVSNEDVTMHNPAGLFVELFQKALVKHGIKITGRVRTMNWQDRIAAPLDTNQWNELGAMESLPVRDIIREVQKPSQNLYTDLMLQHVGASVMNARQMEPLATAEEMGLRELNRFLETAGIKRGETIFDEGSGLSRNNLTTPNATVTLLKFMRKHKDAEIYYNALPIAGVDGTLRNRMKDTPAQNNLRGKTGTLRWANSLSGYVTTAAGEHLVLSIMLNRYSGMGSNRPKTADLDAIGSMLAGFTGRTAKTDN
jgi:D-alanyl-D-alanine carboxypeptidase/D-alanyl-D-alanine-endopeptidase (penicillin-binding protein 4)